MHHLDGLPLDLVVADAVGADEHLSASVRVPGIDDSRFKDHIVHPRSAADVALGGEVGEADGAVEGGQRQHLVARTEHQPVGIRLAALGKFHGLKVVVVLIRNRIVAVVVVLSGLPRSVVDHHLREPAVLSGPVPVAYPGGDLQHVAATQNLGGFALLLIEPHAVGHQHHHAAVAVPAAVGSRGEGDGVGRREVENGVGLDHRPQESLAREGCRLDAFAHGESQLLTRSARRCRLFFACAGGHSQSRQRNHRNVVNQSHNVQNLKLQNYALFSKQSLSKCR